MPYCNARLLVKKFKDKIAILKLLSIEISGCSLQKFTQENPYLFDIGFTNIQAISTDDGRLIRFYCEQAKDVMVFEAKLRSFVLDHCQKCLLLP